ncbi:MAG: hypothetical protein EPN65_22220 [Pandoraea sp.]|uniref:DUF6765 family protein n=1 Tax=Pandoraea sp. TaxID=1883445 RepID=UPI0012126CD1|nr:DUF6765 family protein [Pandoraea sp.]TAM13817.1 MAG: hypothetical protein EPN65_22220 [Pandoraea sp.]TAM51362.1 MAG: hypothetical protein EPN57_19170 [Paraburkholderia sp.]
MHYYATYAMAAAAGIPKEDAETIAYASQNVDDQNDEDIFSVREVGGDFCEAVISIPTAHHPLETGAFAELAHLEREIASAVRRKTNHKEGRDDSRLVWVPFHFLPGNKGRTYLEKLVCQKDSQVANEMLEHHLGLAAEDFGLVLAGIAAHVYIDTFAHYGFSGVTSWLNSVDVSSIRVSDSHDHETKSYIEGSASLFRSLYGALENAAHIGHGGVDTCPDRPFLKWEFRYKQGVNVESRSNPDNFFEACSKLHAFFMCFAERRYVDGSRSSITPFDAIANEVRLLIAQEGEMSVREQAWIQAMERGTLPVAVCDEYVVGSWGVDLAEALAEKNFTRIRSSRAYYFHSAAEYHRHFVLKRLLPKHGLIVA